VLHWDGMQPRWAQWFPDGHRILLIASQSGQAQAVYLTDVDGSTPKQLSPGDAPWGAVAPDGQSFIVEHDRNFVVRSLSDGSSKPLPGIQPEEYPIGW